MSDLQLDIIWCYAEDEDAEQWRGYCETREQAIDEGACELDFNDGGSTFYVGRYRRAKAADYIPGPGHILYMMTESAIDDGYDESEDIDASPQAKEELETFLNAWAAKHVDPISLFIPDGRPERVTVPLAGTAPEGK